MKPINEEISALDRWGSLTRAVDFHGHLCPGLVIGYLAANLALERLGLARSGDEELVAVVENDSCSVDAVQFLLGCTFGKGNLVFRDWGKQVFTISSRVRGKGLRLAFIGDRLRAGAGDRDGFIRALLEAPADDVFAITEVAPLLPGQAVIHPTVSCAICGEGVGGHRALALEGRVVCAPCLGRVEPERALGEKAADFLFEVGMLKKTPRTGYQFLGNGRESVAAHSFRAAVIGYILASVTPEADQARVVAMCLFHDLAEARTGDHNYVNKQYVKTDEARALADAVRGLAAQGRIEGCFAEFDGRQTLEALLAHDADQLDMALELKEKKDLGNPYAAQWLEFAEKRIKTAQGRGLFAQMMKADWAGWWFDTTAEHLWVSPDGG